MTAAGKRHPRSTDGFLKRREYEIEEIYCNYVNVWADHGGRGIGDP